MGKISSIIYQGSKAVCPNCSGLMIGEPLEKICLDCGSKFVCVDSGRSDNELLYEEVTKV